MVSFHSMEDEIEIPTSRLYRLKPMNLGTPLVEALTCYFERDAASMSVLPGILATREIIPRLAPSSTYSNGKTNQIASSWAKNCSPALNGVADSTKDWVSTLEALTLRDDLRFLTMITWAEVISWRGLIKRSMAWCSECFNKMRDDHTTVYSPLIWFLEPVLICIE